MKYEDALKLATPSDPILREFYNQYLDPLLTRSPNIMFYRYFLDQSYLAWRLKVSPEDKKNVQFVEWMCNELININKEEFSKICSIVLSSSGDFQDRARNSEKIFYEALLDKENPRLALDSGIKHYKMFFEHSRLWLTIPYYYACKIIKVKNKATTAESFINVGASEKIKALKAISIELPKGNLRSLVEAFDNELRNAGGGHDFYEITDENTLVLKITDPKTGKLKGSKKRELSLGGLEREIEKNRKAVWILRNGFLIFLNNNPDPTLNFEPTDRPKISHVEDKIQSILEDIGLGSMKFGYQKLPSGLYSVLLKLKVLRRPIGPSSVMFSSGEKFEIIQVSKELSTYEQIVKVVAFILGFTGKNILAELTIEMIGIKDEKMAYFVYAKHDLDAFFEAKNINELTRPAVSNILIHKFITIKELSVPPGSEKIAKVLCASYGFDVL